VRRLLAALLLFAVPGCADGSAPMTRTWDGGMYVDGDVLCGLASEPCCGAGFCEEGLACVAGTCLSSTCGGDGMACCDMGMPCGPGLSCNAGLCGSEPDCGNLGGACCATSPACGGGLACIAGLCREAGGGDCGAVTEACCAGDVCDAGNVCVDGTCREEVPIPMCGPLGSSCSTNADCCDGSCSSGTCSDTPPPPPPPTDPPPPSGSCGGGFSCYDCTLQDGCGWCDGRCVTVDFDPSRPPCADFSHTIIDCF